MLALNSFLLAHIVVLFHYVVHIPAHLKMLCQAYPENHNVLHTFIVLPQTVRLFYHFSDCTGETYVIASGCGSK